ncbi:MAG: tyrosine-protein phosphatase [Candidatus Gastranaerophilales bacterium]|nr:tyrosine-protein phosphatase [Candidatus Gastranaerophilales bacterium]
MLDKIQIIPLNLNILQKKIDKKINIPDYPADKFVRSDKSLSFKGSSFAFDVVSKNFLRGSKPELSDLQALKEIGTKAVIDLIGDSQTNKEKEIVKKLGMKYFHIPLKDNESPTREQVDQFFEIVKNELNLPIFVHCRAGKDRTGIMSAIYSIKVLEQSFERAYEQMLKHKHDFYGNYKQDKFLENYYIENFCKTREEEPSFISKTAKLLRERYLKKLNDISYGGNLSKSDLDSRYA